MYDKAIQLNPQDSEAYNNKGLKYIWYRKFSWWSKTIWGSYKNVWQSHTIESSKFRFLQ